MFTKKPLYQQICLCGDLIECKICRSKYNRKITLSKTDDDKKKAREYAHSEKIADIYRRKK